MLDLTYFYLYAYDLYYYYFLLSPLGVSSCSQKKKDVNKKALDFTAVTMPISLFLCASWSTLVGATGDVKAVAFCRSNEGHMQCF